MKNLFILFLNVLILTFISCTSEDTLNLESNNEAIEKRADEKYEVSCSGPCDCGLQGIAGSDGYLQCKCDECKMHVTYSNSKKQLVEDGKFPLDTEVDIQKVALKSFRNTFSEEPINLKINSIEVNKFNDSDIYQLFYSDDTNRESTVIIYTNYGFAPGGSGGTTTIDCNGSCGCRERFYPKDGSVECTCEPCKMDVSETD
jgi:hypothetical protein